MKQNIAGEKDFEAQALPQLGDLYCAALYLLDNESDAQILVQESFARAYRSWHEGQFNPSCRVWLFRIMVNVFASNYRSSPGPSVATNTDDINGHLLQSRSIDQQQIDDSGQMSSSAISFDDIKKSIRSLPEDVRLIVVLSLLEGFTYQEVADITGTNLETVRSSLYQGRKLMQSELCDHVACGGSHSMTVDRVRRRQTG